MFWPCEIRTSTCRNFATISSGLYRFLAITVLLDVKEHTSSRTTSMGADHGGYFAASPENYGDVRVLRPPDLAHYLQNINFDVPFTPPQPARNALFQIATAKNFEARPPPSLLDCVSSPLLF